MFSSKKACFQFTKSSCFTVQKVVFQLTNGHVLHRKTYPLSLKQTVFCTLIAQNEPVRSVKNRRLTVSYLYKNKDISIFHKPVPLVCFL